MSCSLCDVHDKRILSSKTSWSSSFKSFTGLSNEQRLLSSVVCFEKKEDFYGMLREKSSFYSKADNDCDLCSKRQSSEI